MKCARTLKHLSIGCMNMPARGRMDLVSSSTKYDSCFDSGVLTTGMHAAHRNTVPTIADGSLKKDCTDRSQTGSQL